MLLLALILLIASMAIVASRYISKLERQIYQRDSLIRELSISDQLVKEYFNIEIDSTGHKVSYSLKDDKKTRVVERIETIRESQFSFDGKTVSPDEVIKKYNELQNEANSLNKEYHSLINKYNSLADRSGRVGHNAYSRNAAEKLVQTFQADARSHADEREFKQMGIVCLKCQFSFVIYGIHRGKLIEDIVVEHQKHRRRCWIILYAKETF